MDKKTATAILMAICFLCSACSGKQEKTAAPITVKTTQASATTEPQSKEFPFISKPFRRSELSFRVSGPIDRFEVYAGNHYKQGSIIAEIDSRDFRLRHENAEAAYHKAKSDYERIEALYRKDNVSASTYETAHAAYIAAKTAYNTTLNELNDTRLRAPFDGYAGEVYIEKFQDVKASQPILSLVDISRLKIEVYVTQDIVQRASKLKTLNLTFDSRPGEVFTANIVEYSKNTTPNNLSYLLTALLPNPDGSLPSGLSGKVFFDLPGGDSQGVSIPQIAVCHQPSQGDYVWAVDVDTQTVSRRKIRLGELHSDGRYSVQEGLNAGEHVAVSGLRFLSDGMTVALENNSEKR